MADVAEGTFWSNSGVEPRRNFKFLLTIGEVPVWVVKNVTLPKITVEEGSHKFLNHTFYFPGTVTYNTVSFTMVDAIDKKISQNILGSFMQGGYQIPSDVNVANASLITKSDASSGLGTVTISQLGASAQDDKDEFHIQLVNSWIKDLEFPQGLSYDSQDPTEIKVEIRYDFFTAAAGAAPLVGFGEARPENRG